MSEARYLVGDVFERMAELPDSSIDLIVTSGHCGGCECITCGQER